MLQYFLFQLEHQEIYCVFFFISVLKKLDEKYL